MLAAFFERKEAPIYLAVASGCGAIWQTLIFGNLSHEWFPFYFAALGIGLIGNESGSALERYGPGIRSPRNTDPW